MIGIAFHMLRNKASNMGNLSANVGDVVDVGRCTVMHGEWFVSAETYGKIHQKPATSGLDVHNTFRTCRFCPKDLSGFLPSELIFWDMNTEKKPRRA